MYQIKQIIGYAKDSGLIVRKNNFEVVDGEYDDLPEQAFYMVGGIEEVLAKAEKMATKVA